jgi:hypothetical protein
MTTTVIYVLYRQMIDSVLFCFVFNFFVVVVVK